MELKTLEPPKYKYINSEDEAKRVISKLDSKPELSIDTETTWLDPYTSKVFLIQINDGDKNYVFDTRYYTEHSTVHPELFNDLWQNSSLKILQNALFDMKMLKVHGGVYLNNVYDTMIAEQLLTLGIPRARSNLSFLMQKYLGLNMPKEPRKTFSDDTIKLKPYQLEYAANDVVPLRLIMDLQKSYLEEEDLLHVSQLEFDFLKPLCEMELNGIRMDENKWDIVMTRIGKDAVDLEKEVSAMLSSTDDQTALFGTSTVNINSSKQLLTALKRYGLEDLEATDVSLLNYYKDVPVVGKLLEYRKYKKLASTYGQTLLDKINPVTGRLHTSFRQMVATGRLSSSNPNLQNIPNKQLYRTGFISEEGYTLLTADQSGAELRILGNLSKDPLFIKAFKEGLDLHTLTASGAFKTPYDKVKPEQRTKAKPLNFGIVYGLSKYGLAKQLNIHEKEAEEMINNFFEQYVGVKNHLEESAKSAMKNNYTLTVSGRKRYYELPPFYDPDFKSIAAKVKRRAKNHPVQGSNADVIKKAMIYLVDRLEESGLDARLVLTVHDEVVVETKNNCIEEVKPIISSSILDGFSHYFKTIPMETDVLSGPCWLKGLCEKKDDSGKKCMGAEMKFIPDEELGTKLVCAKCGGDMQ